MGFKEALSIRGKISFAEGQTFGRVTAPLARLLSKWAAVGARRPLDDEMELALRWGMMHLETAGPRVIEPRRFDAPCLVFIDGACEDRVSIGGVLFCPGRAVEYFGAVVPEGISKSWKSSEMQTQVIGQAELFPALVARLTWGSALENRRVIFFIDNESARIALARAYSPVLPSLNLVMQCLWWDFEHRVHAWYARVPTDCNIADGPSRMDPEEVRRLWGARAVRPVFPEGAGPMEVLLQGWWMCPAPFDTKHISFAFMLQ